MSARVYKVILLVGVLACIAAAGFTQNHLNRQRAALGITNREPLENAPPVLALTTQVLGGFRGLIANALWIRAQGLQDEAKFFEMVQLGDWITKLEPHFVHVWLVQAWNMAYNISVKFSDHRDRWRWVQHGIELLRDGGLQYNPSEVLIYRELSWFFQHKMGQNLDEAHLYYKRAWAFEMMALFDGERPNFERLIAPQSVDEQQRAQVLRQRYKMDPARMKQIDDTYGPLDWRLPEAHAIYWAITGLDYAKTDDLLPLRRVIYQSMNLSFQRGRLILTTNSMRLLPNLQIVEKTDKAYRDQIAADAEKRDAIQRAHLNFLREVPYQFFINNRIRDGEQWLRYLREQYPEALPPDLTLAEYAVERATENVREQSQVKMTGLVQAMVAQSYFALIEGNNEEANEYMLRASQIWNAYDKKIKSNERLAIPTINETKEVVLRDMLDPEGGVSPEAQARLRTVLPQLAEKVAPLRK